MRESCTLLLEGEKCFAHIYLRDFAHVRLRENPVKHKNALAYKKNSENTLAKNKKEKALIFCRFKSSYKRLNFTHDSLYLFNTKRFKT